MVSKQGWQELVSKTNRITTQVGKAAVWPGIQDDLLKDKLTRANERLRFIREVEDLASKTEKMQDNFDKIKDI